MCIYKIPTYIRSIHNMHIHIIYEIAWGNITIIIHERKYIICLWYVAVCIFYFLLLQWLMTSYDTCPYSNFSNKHKTKYIPPLKGMFFSFIPEDWNVFECFWRVLINMSVYEILLIQLLNHLQQLWGCELFWNELCRGDYLKGQVHFFYDIVWRITE